MPLFLRRIIFYILLVVFLMAAPILIAYTAGYRWSFTQHRFLKTGALSIISTPDNATILINGTAYRTLTPALINDLLPGHYQIAVIRDGYHPWGKTLPIESERTTFATAITLFKNSEPQITDSIDPSLLAQAPASLPAEHIAPFTIIKDTARNTIAVINNDTHTRVTEVQGERAIWREKPSPLLFIYSPHEVWRFDPKSQTTALVTRLIDEIKFTLPLPRKDAILLVLKDRILALELDTRNVQNSWDIATFDQIKNTSLSEDGKTLFIEGTHLKQKGFWKLEL